MYPLVLAVRALPLALRAAVCPSVGLLVAASLHHAAHRRPAGRSRLGTAVAAIAAFLALPLMFDAQRERVAATLACQWPCSTSLLVSDESKCWVLLLGVPHGAWHFADAASRRTR